MAVSRDVLVFNVLGEEQEVHTGYNVRTSVRILDKIRQVRN